MHFFLDCYIYFVVSDPSIDFHVPWYLNIPLPEVNTFSDVAGAIVCWNLYCNICKVPSKLFLRQHHNFVLVFCITITTTCYVHCWFILLTLFRYPPPSFSFISLCLIWWSCNILEYIHPDSWFFPSYGIFNLSEWFILPHYISNALQFFVPNFIPVSRGNTCTAFIKKFTSLSFFSHSSRSSMKNRWLLFMQCFSNGYPHSSSRVEDNDISRIL